MGAHKKVHIRQISKNENVAKRWQQRHGRKPEEEDVEAMFQEFIPLQIGCLAQYADLIPGTLGAVAEFRRRGAHQLQEPITATLLVFSPPIVAFADFCDCASRGPDSDGLRGSAPR